MAERNVIKEISQRVDARNAAKNNPATATGGARPASDRPDFPTPKPPAAPPAIPADAKGFQQYLKDHGANLGKTGPKKDGVDGIIGPKTLAEAARLGIAVPEPLAPKPPPTPAVAPTQSTQQQQSSPTDVAPAALPNLTSAQIRARYGYLGAILDFPDVAAVISQYSADPAMTDEQFLAKLHNTPTWSSHNQNELDWLSHKGEDQQSLVASQRTPIETEAKRLGLDVGGDRLNEIATTAAKEKWNSAQISQALAAEFKYKAGGQTGAIGAAEQSIKQTAAQYLVPIADSTLAQWDAQIAAGTATPETFKQYIVTQAKGLFPSLAKQLDAGLTVDQLADPYRQMAAQELNMNPEAIDFKEARWLKALSTTDPNNPTGAPTMMGLADWQKTLRRDPTYGWDETINGRTANAQMAVALTQALGVRA